MHRPCCLWELNLFTSNQIINRARQFEDAAIGARK
jgi:hypothetical protein